MSDYLKLYNSHDSYIEDGGGIEIEPKTSGSKSYSIPSADVIVTISGESEDALDIQSSGTNVENCISVLKRLPLEMESYKLKLNNTDDITQDLTFVLLVGMQEHFVPYLTFTLNDSEGLVVPNLDGTLTVNIVAIKTALNFPDNVPIIILAGQSSRCVLDQNDVDILDYNIIPQQIFTLNVPTLNTNIHNTVTYDKDHVHYNRYFPFYTYTENFAKTKQLRELIAVNNDTTLQNVIDALEWINLHSEYDGKKRFGQTKYPFLGGPDFSIVTDLQKDPYENFTEEELNTPIRELMVRQFDADKKEYVFTKVVGFAAFTGEYS